MIPEILEGIPASFISNVAVCIVTAVFAKYWYRLVRFKNKLIGKDVVRLSAIVRFDFVEPLQSEDLFSKAEKIVGSIPGGDSINLSFCMNGAEFRIIIDGNNKISRSLSLKCNFGQVQFKRLALTLVKIFDVQTAVARQITISGASMTVKAEPKKAYWLDSAVKGASVKSVVLADSHREFRFSKGAIELDCKLRTEDIESAVDVIASVTYGPQA